MTLSGMEKIRQLSMTRRSLFLICKPNHTKNFHCKNLRSYSSQSSSSNSHSLLNKPVISVIVGASAIGAGVLAFSPSVREKLFGSKKSQSQEPEVASSGTGSSSSSSSTEPSSSDLIPNLPEEINYLLIGGGSASFGATRAIRVNDPKSKIIIVSNEEHKPYLRPPLSKEIWLTPPEVSSKLSFRQYNGADKDIHFEHEEFYQSLEKLAAKETGGVAVVHGVTVTKVDTDENIAHLSNGQKIKFGKCLLATGGEDVVVKCLEKLPSKMRKEQVIYYRNLNDFQQLNNIFEDRSNKGKAIAIIGGQFGGTELAAVLARRSHIGGYGLSITQIVEDSGVLSSILPEYLSKFVTLKVLKEGAQVLTNARIAGATVDPKDNNRIQLSLADGGNVTADFIVVTDPKISPDSPEIALVDRNASLADASNLEIETHRGGFLANSELQVKSNVYTAGDCANYYDYLTKERRRGGHHDFAIASGRHAGQNMTGKSLNFKYTPFYWSDIGPDISIEAVGDISSSYETTGVFLSLPISSLSLPGEEKESVADDKSSKSDEKSVAPISREMNESESMKTPESEYERGVLFYYKNKTLVGILMINLFNKVHLSRRILQDRTSVKYNDPSELAKLYHIYSVED